MAYGRGHRRTDPTLRPSTNRQWYYETEEAKALLRHLDATGAAPPPPPPHPQQAA